MKSMQGMMVWWRQAVTQRWFARRQYSGFFKAWCVAALAAALWCPAFATSQIPAVSSISPSSGPTAGGTSVTISGVNFTGASAVRFGASASVGYTVVNDSTITATSPAGSGVVDVTVTTFYGTSTASSSDHFTYAPVPSITGLSPATGATAGGTSVTITGTGFNGTTSVQFGGTAASGVTVNSSTSITVTTPAHAAGLVDVTVTTPGGTSATSSADQFTYGTPTALLTVNANTNLGGSITGGGTFAVGSNVVLTATASNGWVFSQWSDGTRSNRLGVTVTTNCTYTAYFAPSPTTHYLYSGALTNITVGPGVYSITAYGAQGGSVIGWGTGGLGAAMSAEFYFPSATNLTLLVGGMGGSGSGGGGGGGSFVVNGTPAPLVIAGGGGGGGMGGGLAGGGGILGGGGDGFGVGVNGGVGGMGGRGGLGGGGGGGFLGDGDSAPGAGGGTAYIHGGGGGLAGGGGFGGGGGGSSLGNGGGGGGGYSGGGGGGGYSGGGGGGSIIDASAILVGPNFAGTNSGNGKIDIVAIPFLVTATAAPGGTALGGGFYNAGTSTQLTATASNGWAFTGWSDGATNNPYTITVPPSNVTFTANFALAATITVNLNTNLGGSVSGGGTFLVGSNAVLTATASNAWVFIHWDNGATNNPYTITVPATNIAYTANFVQLSTVVGVANPGNAGRVTGGGASFVGSNATLTAVASNGWLFANWNGAITNNPWTFAVTSTSVVCTANFGGPVVIGVAASPAWCGSVTGGGTYAAGGSAVLVATPAPGYDFVAWSDGDTHASHTITAPATARTYTASFAMGLGAALNADNVEWSTGAHPWLVQSAINHDGIAALQSGALSAGQSSYVQLTTNGPASLSFWWKVSSAQANPLQFFNGTQLVAQIAGNQDWSQFITFIGTSNQVTLTWVYDKTTSAVAGSDAGWLDQVAWTPCPYSEHAPQLFFQDPNGLMASWVFDTNGVVLFPRQLANVGGRFLKTAGDLDGDGVSDLLFQNAAGDTCRWFMNADGSLREARPWWNIGDWEIMACGDFDGTHTTQVFFQRANGDTAYWQLDTNGEFVASVPLGNQGSWRVCGLGDVNGDHKAEVFLQNGSGLVAMWYHNGSGGISGVVQFNLGAQNTYALRGVLDVDGDGVGDLIWQDPSNGNLAKWIMQTNAIPSSGGYWYNCGYWTLKAMGH